MKRILRVIEYVGTDEFLRKCIEERTVKGTKTIPMEGIIREAILGDTPEILTKEAEASLQLGPIFPGEAKT